MEEGSLDINGFDDTFLEIIVGVEERDVLAGVPAEGVAANALVGCRRCLADTAGVNVFLHLVVVVVSMIFVVVVAAVELKNVLLLVAFFSVLAFRRVRILSKRVSLFIDE